MEKNKLKKVLWGLAALIMIAIVVTGIAIYQAKLPYKLTVEQTLTELNNKDNVVDAASLQLIKQAEKTIFIDLRNPIEYNFSHYQEAINIPAEKILIEENMEVIQEIQDNGNTIVLYADVPQKAAGTWMLLKQIGIDKVKMFSGTYDQLMSEQLLPVNLFNEIPVIDTAALQKKNEPANTNTPKIAVPKKAVSPMRAEPQTGGGC